MLAIFKKEFNSFFTSTIAYLTIGIFLLINGLFLWVFDDDFNILNAGFADLTSFFYLAPWILIFLIPAITMKTFADEFRSGTIEILKTRPITHVTLVLGKFFATLTLLIIVLIPTFVYAYSIHELGNPVGNIDYGSISGSYIGLLLLASSFASIGIFTSTLTKNQVVAFLLGICVVFLFYYGFDAVSSLFGNYLYFMSVIIFFLFVSKQKLTNE